MQKIKEDIRNHLLIVTLSFDKNIEIHALSVEGTEKRSVHCIKTLEKPLYKYLPKYLWGSNQLTV